MIPKRDIEICANALSIRYIYGITIGMPDTQFFASHYIGRFFGCRDQLHERWVACVMLYGSV